MHAVVVSQNVLHNFCGKHLHWYSGSSHSMISDKKVNHTIRKHNNNWGAISMNRLDVRDKLKLSINWKILDLTGIPGRRWRCMLFFFCGIKYTRSKGVNHTLTSITKIRVTNYWIRPWRPRNERSCISAYITCSLTCMQQVRYHWALSNQAQATSSNPEWKWNADINTGLNIVGLCFLGSRESCGFNCYSLQPRQTHKQKEEGL